MAMGAIFRGSRALVATRGVIAKMTQIVPNGRRSLSSSGNQAQGDNAKDTTAVVPPIIKKSVFISQSYDVFTNLALEDWIYKNYDLSAHHVLLLWANDPCVVIGRHQNPFSEAHVSQLCREGVTLARRNSGGGAVYHDRGNLNCTFFTARAQYDRWYNLNIVTRSLFREYGISADISDRHDITLFGKKVSGTAAKLGRPNAYHHCTLLVNANKLHLSGSLVKHESEIVSNATASVRSPIKNLSDVNKRVNIPDLLSAIGYEYLRTDPLNLEIESRELMEKQRGFQLINPTEKWFPGLDASREMFASWDWRIGKTPKFSVLKDVRLKSTGQEVDQQTGAAEDANLLKLKVDVVSGLITNVSISHPDSADEFPVVTSLKGQPYTEDNLGGIIDALMAVSTANVRQAINGN